MASSDIAGQISQLDQGYDPAKIYSDLTAKLGIPDARQRVIGLQTAISNSEAAIKNVDPSVTGRTQNSLVTEAQRQRLVNMEKSPLTDQYNTQTTNYNTENGNLTKLTDQANQEAGLAESSYKTKRQSLADQLQYALGQEQIQRDQQQAAQTAAAKASGGGGGGAGAAAKGPTSQQRKGGGYNFQNANGQSISARLYAQLTGTNFNTLLKTMAANGDTGAADVLKNGSRSAAYKALTWN